MSTLQGTPCPDFVVSTDRRQQQDEFFRRQVAEGNVKEYQLVSDRCPSLEEICHFLDIESPSILWVNDEAYVCGDPLGCFDATTFVSFTLDGAHFGIAIQASNDSAAQVALLFVLGLPSDGYEKTSVGVRAGIPLQPECVHSMLAAHPGCAIEIMETVCSAEACSVLLSMGKELTFCSVSTFQDEGDAMVRALQERIDPENIHLYFSNTLPMSERNLIAILHRSGLPSLGKLTIRNIKTGTPVMAKWLATANVTEVVCVNCNFEWPASGIEFVTSHPTGPESMRLLYCQGYLIPFYIGIATSCSLLRLEWVATRSDISQCKYLDESFEISGSLTSLRFFLPRNDRECWEPLFESLSKNVSIKEISLHFDTLNSGLPGPTPSWLAEDTIKMIRYNRTIQSIRCSGNFDHSEFTPYLECNRLRNRMQDLKESGASAALVGAALIKLCNKKNRTNHSLTWILLSEYSSMLTSHFT